MSDHRRLQRTLFRMQADAGFARAVLAGEEGAEFSAEDLALLLTVDPAALSADPGGKRRAQIAGNAASEFELTLAAAARSRGNEDFLDAFLAAPEFHEVMTKEGRLPLAFGAYALRRAEESGDGALRTVALLELELARLRRQSIPIPHPPLGERESDGTGREAVARNLRESEIVLAPTARLIELPARAFEWSQALRAALDRGTETPPPPSFTSATDTILCVVRPPFSPHRLPEVRTERLEPPTDELFRRTREPLSKDARARFADEHGAAADDLEVFLEAFVDEGVLVIG